MTIEAIQNENAAEAFAGRLLENLNAGAVTIMVGIGHRTGLFDTMAGLAPSSSEEIAAAAGLDERYVREWLATMVTGGIVDHDPNTGTYALPELHAMFLTSAAGTDNLAQPAQFVAILGTVEDRIVECFRSGGGVPYEAFSRFHDFMAEDSKATVADALVDHILPLVPGLADRLRRGIDVLDIGCGRGHALATLARAFPRSRFLGIDISESAIAFARRQAASDSLANVRYEIRDAASPELPGSFDLITAFDAIHDQARPAVVLESVSALLAPDGVFLMQDIAGSSHLEKNLDHPLAPFLYTVSCMHCMTVSLSQGGVGLGTRWGEELAGQMLRDAGFREVRIERLSHDFMNCYYVARH